MVVALVVCLFVYFDLNCFVCLWVGLMLGLILYLVVLLGLR